MDGRWFDVGVPDPFLKSFCRKLSNKKYFLKKIALIIYPHRQEVEWNRSKQIPSLNFPLRNKIRSGCGRWAKDPYMSLAIQWGPLIRCTRTGPACGHRTTLSVVFDRNSVEWRAEHFCRWWYLQAFKIFIFKWRKRIYVYKRCILKRLNDKMYLHRLIE